MLGCETPTQVAVWETEEYEFFNCPLRFVSNSVWEWCNEYAYAKDLGTALPYNLQSNLFLEAWAVYSSEYNERIRKKMKHDKERDQSQDGLESLRAGFLQRGE
jgi:hypothetical protein